MFSPVNDQLELARRKIVELNNEVHRLRNRLKYIEDLAGDDGDRLLYDDRGE